MIGKPGFRRGLREALISTGDELPNPGQPLDAGCIDDSRRAGLAVHPVRQPRCAVAALGTFHATVLKALMNLAAGRSCRPLYRGSTS